MLLGLLDWRFHWRLGCLWPPSKIWFSRFLPCALVFDSSPTWLSASCIALSPWTAKWSTEGTAWRASMLLCLDTMTIEMLASKSRMVVHITICAIDSRVFGGSSINIEDILGPLHVLLLLILRQCLLLPDWTRRIRGLACIQEGLLEAGFTNVCPSQSLFLRILSICWIGRNTLSTLGGTFGGPLLTVFAFPCPHSLLSLGAGLGAPCMESLDKWFPKGILVQTKDFDHASGLICMIDKTLTLLLWTDHILMIPLIGWKDEDLAIPPCSRCRWKVFRLGEDLIELYDHLIGIFELCILRQCDSSWNLLWIHWSETDHHT